MIEAPVVLTYIIESNLETYFIVRVVLRQSLLNYNPLSGKAITLRESPS